MRKSSYKFYIDILNICACIAVVALHVNGVFWNFSYDRYWITSNFIETFFYWAVPIFLMISGINLIDYRRRYNTKEYFKKRISKTLIPYTVWTVIACIWNVLYIKNYSFGDYIGVRNIFDTFINSKSMTIYWFFPLIFSIYMMIPLLGLVPYEKRLGKEGVYTYYIIYSFLTVSIAPLLCNLIGISWNGNFSVAASGSLMLVLLGYYIDNIEIKFNMRIAIYLLGIIGWLLQLFMVFRMSYKIGAIDSTFKGYYNLPCILNSVAVLVVFKYYKWENTILYKFKNNVSKISKHSYGIYLVHYFYIQFITKIFDIDMRSILWRVFGIIIIYSLSLVTVILLKKFPVIKEVV